MYEHRHTFYFSFQNKTQINLIQEDPDRDPPRIDTKNKKLPKRNVYARQQIV
jgi:hypothetical protein